MTKISISFINSLLSRVRNRHFIVADVFFLSLTPALALLLQVESIAEASDLRLSLIVVTLCGIVIKLTYLYSFKLYKRFWQFASVDEAARLLLVFGLSLATLLVVFYGLRGLGLISLAFPVSTLVIEALFAGLLLSATRFSIRLAERVRQRAESEPGSKRVMVVGAGEAGVQVVSEMQRKSILKMFPAVFVDDDLKKHSAQIRSITVEGSCDDIPRIAQTHDISHVVIAIPSAPGHVIRRIVKNCQDVGLQTQIIPSIGELLEGRVLVSQLRPVRIEDLLRREPVVVDETEILLALKDTRVLVTGGGGSIGSELCRQILSYHPSELVLLDHSENAVFELEQDLRIIISENSHPETVLHPVIADIRDLKRLSRIFEAHRPEIVFHAAAHKHVPLMEAHACEAVTNNVLGTRNVISLSDKFEVDRFVMISSDKAVNPTSVMGATKRVAELLVRQHAVRKRKAYAAVRFGNVLGSRGSVVPLFQKQIEQGGPITITHPEIRRYFMSIPEAVQLVLQAGVLSACGELFVLDMGAPIKIADLADDLIRLSGLESGIDIEIKFTGLRPGEKLFEELFLDNESYESTRHEKIFVSRDLSEYSDTPALDDDVDRLILSALEGNASEVIQLLERIVPECQFERSCVEARA